jgi:hypothetical protein
MPAFPLCAFYTILAPIADTPHSPLLSSWGGIRIPALICLVFFLLVLFLVDSAPLLSTPFSPILAPMGKDQNAKGGLVCAHPALVLCRAPHYG